MALGIDLDDSETVYLGDDLAGEWEEYDARGRIVREAKKRQEEIKVRTAEALGERHIGLLPSGEIVQRKRVERKGYTVPDSSYSTITKKKGKK